MGRHSVDCTHGYSWPNKGGLTVSGVGCELSSLVAAVGLCSEGKGVDPGYLAKDWVVENITKTAAFREGTGDCADDKLRFIHSRIIGTDIAVCLIQRTVHDDGIRVRDRRPEARILQPG